MYNKYLKNYPSLQNFHNQALFKTTFVNAKGELITIEEFFVSGRKELLFDSFGSPPKLPPNTVEVLNDYEKFKEFAKGAIETGKNRNRMFDSELKYIFNFLKKHAHQANEFEIEITSLIKVCDSCSRELLMLEDYLKAQGKKVTFVVKQNEKIISFKQLLKEINK